MAFVQAIDSNGKVVDRTLRPVPGSHIRLTGIAGTSVTVTSNSILRFAALGQGVTIRFNNSFPGTATVNDMFIPVNVVEYFRIDSNYTTIYKMSGDSAYTAGTATLDIME